MQRDDLSKEFNLQTFKQLVTNLVDTELYSEAKDIHHSSEVISRAQNIGQFLNNRFSNVLVITHTATISARVKLATDTFKLMADNNIDKALVAYVSSTKEKEWRFSYISISLEEVKGKIKKSFTNPRRYSYVLGPNSKTQTPYQYLIKKGKVAEYVDLLKRFSIEVVNNEFYKEIAKLYDELVGTETIERKLVYPSDGDDSHEFAVRLIGRIIFCWFLREKKSSSGLALIPEDILSKNAASHDNFYHETLAPLFFEVLNKPLEKRAPRYASNGFKEIPYLNGGLFASDEIDKYKFDRSLEISVPGLVKVPDGWLRSFFDLLERFNFTVDENISFDTELSIDPEMLGRVFENLLARINPETGETVRKSTGSFYTPREIVDYMVDSSLTEYLIDKTNIAKEKIEALVSYDLLDDVGNELDKEERELALQTLSDLKVLDPACGSGAYPIGMLQKIVYVISILDPEAKWWLDKQLSGASPELKKEFQNKGVDYIRKLGIIRQTIFGVDIQPIATEISRLRCFLTLIVDEKVNDDLNDNRGVKPLPNLEFKFVTANTLINLPQQQLGGKQVQQDMFDSTQKEKIEKLNYLISDYFVASQSEKSEIKAEYRYTQNLLWGDMHRSSNYGQQSLALTVWDPFTYQKTDWFDPTWMMGVEDGFNIVIANPPYIRVSGIHKEYDRTIRNNYDLVFGHYDMYIPFFERAIHLTSKSGFVCFITPNSYLTKRYGNNLRPYLLKNTQILSLLDLSQVKVFESASVYSLVTLLKVCEPLPKQITRSKRLTEFAYGKSISWYLTEQNVFLNNQNSIIDIEISPFERQLFDRIDALTNPLSTIGRALTGTPAISLYYEWPTIINNDSESDSTGSDSRLKLINVSSMGDYYVKWGGNIRIAGETFHDATIEYNDNLIGRNKWEVFKKHPKVIVKGTALKLTAALDEVGYANVSIYSLIFNNEEFYRFNHALLGILNSRLLNYWYTKKFASNNIGGNYITFNGIYLNQLPLPMEIINNSSSSEIDELTKTVEVIIQKKKSGNSASTTIEENKVNELVYTIYHLSKDEIMQVESSLNE